MERQQRITDQLQAYWQVLSKYEGGVPKESMIDPKALKSIWENCFLVKKEPGETKFRYSFLGSELMKAFGDEAKHTAADSVEELVSPYMEQSAGRFREVVSMKRPLHDEGEFKNHDQVTIKYRQILLPFTIDGETVSHILGGIRWRVE